jgi:hypothetical protein
MRRLQAILITATLLLGSESSSAAQTIKAGSTCLKLKEVRIVGSQKFACIKSGKKLVWNKVTQTDKSKPGIPLIPAGKSPTAEKTPVQSQDVSPVAFIEPPTGVIAIYSGAKPIPNKNAKQSFEVKSSLSLAKSSSNLKFWIYDPENNSAPLGSPGLFIQKDGGSWNFLGKDRSDGGFDTRLDAGRYLVDVVEPNGNLAKYDRGRYVVEVDSAGKLSVQGMMPNSAGYFTVTAVVKNLPAATKTPYQPANSCQLLDKTGSTNMSNGFPRADGRLPNRGVVKALIIPVEFTDVKGTGSPAEIYREMAKGTADFFYKQSRQTVKFEFTTLSEYLNLKVPVNTFKMGSYNGGDPYSYLQAGLKAVENLIDISDFDIAYVLPPSTVRPDQIAYGPAFPAQINSNNYENATGRVLNAVTGGADAWQSLSGAGWKWMSHETGHTFGLYDWYTLDGTNPYGPWDLMSHNWSTEAIELNAWNRYISGWLSDSQVKCLELNQLSGTPKSYLIEAIGVDSSKPKSVMVKLNDSRILVIEARATAGLDKLQANQTGILVYVVDTSVPTIKGIAKTYSRANVDTSLRDAPLKPGESISVEGVTIKANSKSGLDFELVISK